MRIHALVASALALAAAVPAFAAPPPAPPLEAYGALPAFENMTLSPSGDRLAYVTSTGGERRLVVGTTDGRVIFSSPVGDSKLRDIDWAGDEHVLVDFTRTLHLKEDANGQQIEVATVLQIDLRTQKPFWIFGTGAGPSAVYGQYGSRLIGGTWYGYYERPDLGGPSELFQVNLDTGALKSVSKSGERGTSWLIDPGGAVAVREEYDSARGEWRVIVGDRGGRTLIASKSHSTSLAGLGRKPGTVLIRTEDEDDGAVRLSEVSLTGDGAAQPVGDGLTLKSSFRNSSGLLIGLVSREAPGVTFFDPQLNARWKGAEKAMAGYEVRLASHTDDLQKMVIFTDGGDDAGTYFLIDTKTGTAEPLGRAYPGVAPEQVGPTRMVSYKAADGLAMEGVLTLPPGRDAKNLPLVVLPHGGPIVPGDRVGFDWWAQAFASRGYAVFQPNYRGSQGYGGAFEKAANGEWGRKMQTDLSDGVAALAAQGLIDPKRVCIVGASYGGYAALAGVTMQHGIYRCAASVAGVSDLRAMVAWAGDRSGFGGDTMRYFRKVMGLTNSRDPVLDKISPARFAAQADAPILLVHGKDDTVVPIEQTQIMERELKRAGKPVQTVVMEKEDHWLSRQATRTQMLKAVVGFVEAHNPAT
jgi:acetyl esterase/lipase